MIYENKNNLFSVIFNQKISKNYLNIVSSYYDSILISKKFNFDKKSNFFEMMLQIDRVLGKIPDDIKLQYPNIKKNYEKKSNKKSILLSCVPKSGSDYIAGTLTQNLKLQRYNIGNAFHEGEIIDPRTLIKFKIGGCLGKGHFYPNKFNLNFINRLGLKVWVHLREPKEIIVSWYHFLEKASNANDFDSTNILFSIFPNLPSDYFELSKDKKIDFQIKNFLPYIKKYQIKWNNLSKSKQFKNSIKISNYQLLMQDKKFISEIY